jgi:hypothetical protein
MAVDKVAFRKHRAVSEAPLSKNTRRNNAGVIAAIVILSTYSSSAGAASTTPLAPATMARIGTVDERFQSFNIEMIEVTGGRFWKPYKNIDSKAVPASSSATAPYDND